jgi:redox-sensitive bicupin YhaK (pirin superfamily)
LKHSDSMGHAQVLGENEVQAMSAGTGIFHSEVNNSPDMPVRLLQIWVFPEQRNIEPRYEQKAFDPALRNNQWQLLAGPDPRHGEMELKQQAWFSRTDLAVGTGITYELKNKQNGIYLFVISGSVDLGGAEQLLQRDGIGIWELENLKISALENSELLVIEVPVWD